MSRLFGGALGLAVLSTIATGASHAPAGAGPLQAMTNGFGVAFDVAAVITLVGAVLALTLLGRPARAEVAGTVVSPDREESSREQAEAEAEVLAA
jgi:hypothetical protein